ncbi:MAG: lytic transglycosylase domain-containing protein [Bdellovibrionota bacterium]
MVKSNFGVIIFIAISVLGLAVSTHAEEKSNRSRLREVLESWLPTVGDDSAPSGSPTTFGDGSSLPLTPADILSAEDLKAALPWRSTSFANQTGTLGWSESTFDVPTKMKDRVAFWRDIYAKYTTEQGVLHDSVHVQIVYTPIDFSTIMKDPSLSFSQKARAREDFIESKRTEILERLQRLSNVTDSEGLAGDDLRVWEQFSRIDDPQKFSKAMEKNRIRFQLGQKDRFLLGIYYSGRYLRSMEEIFRKEGLPIELTRLPFVESSFNVNARSKVGASGIWQFMPRTGKEYMKVNKDVDERNDPLISTRASARLLKQNYQMLQSWSLALTGYNHGAYGVRSITQKFGTDDLSELIEKDPTLAFGFASQNFYACFLAALEVERNASLAFSDPKWSPEIESADFKTGSSQSWRAFLEFFDGDETLAKSLNPHLTSRVREGKAKIPVGIVLRAPPNRVRVAENFFSGKFPASKIGTQLKGLPMPKSLYSASSVLTAARSVIRARLAQPPKTSQLVLPEILASVPRTAEASLRAPLTPAHDDDEPEVLSIFNPRPASYRSSGEESP